MTLGSGESKLETGISYLLIVGVIISLILEIVGIIILYHSYGHLAISQDAGMFIQGHDFFSFIPAVSRKARSRERRPLHDRRHNRIDINSLY